MNSSSRPVDVIGIDHIYVSVRDLERSESFYDAVMQILDFRKVARPLAGGDMHIHYYNRILQFSLRPAAAGSPDHDSYAPGLHHFCFRVAEASDVPHRSRLGRRRGLWSPRRVTGELHRRSDDGRAAPRGVPCQPPTPPGPTPAKLVHVVLSAAPAAGVRRPAR